MNGMQGRHRDTGERQQMPIAVKPPRRDEFLHEAGWCVHGRGREILQCHSKVKGATAAFTLRDFTRATEGRILLFHSLTDRDRRYDERLSSCVRTGCRPRSVDDRAYYHSFAETPETFELDYQLYGPSSEGNESLQWRDPDFVKNVQCIHNFSRGLQRRQREKETECRALARAQRKHLPTVLAADTSRESQKLWNSQPRFPLRCVCVCACAWKEWLRDKVAWSEELFLANSSFTFQISSAIKFIPSFQNIHQTYSNLSDLLLIIWMRESIRTCKQPS